MIKYINVDKNNQDNRKDMKHLPIFLPTFPIFLDRKSKCNSTDPELKQDQDSLLKNKEGWMD